jgi:hypothetical protein
MTCILVCGGAPSVATGLISKVASIPSAVNASASAIAVSYSAFHCSSEVASGSDPACKRMLTFSTWAPSQMCIRLPGRWKPWTGQSSSFHPAFQRGISIYLRRSMISGNCEFTPLTYQVPENCLIFSAIRSICSGLSCRRALNSSSSRILSSARRCNSSLSLLAERWNSTSPSTAAAIASSMNPSVVRHDLNATAASKTNAATTPPADHIARRLFQLSPALSSSLLLLSFVVFKPAPLHSRPTGRDTLFWVGVGLWVLYGIALLIFILRA